MEALFESLIRYMHIFRFPLPTNKQNLYTNQDSYFSIRIYKIQDFPSKAIVIYCGMHKKDLNIITSKLKLQQNTKNIIQQV